LYGLLVMSVCLLGAWVAFSALSVDKSTPTLDGTAEDEWTAPDYAVPGRIMDSLVNETSNKGSTDGSAMAGGVEMVQERIYTNGGNDDGMVGAEIAPTVPPTAVAAATNTAIKIAPAQRMPQK